MKGEKEQAEKAESSGNRQEAYIQRETKENVKREAVRQTCRRGRGRHEGEKEALCVCELGGL